MDEGKTHRWWIREDCGVGWQRSIDAEEIWTHDYCWSGTSQGILFQRYDGAYRDVITLDQYQSRSLEELTGELEFQARVQGGRVVSSRPCKIFSSFLLLKRASLEDAHQGKPYMRREGLLPNLPHSLPLSAPLTVIQEVHQTNELTHPISSGPRIHRQVL